VLLLLLKIALCGDTSVVKMRDSDFSRREGLYWAVVNGWVRWGISGPVSVDACSRGVKVSYQTNRVAMVTKAPAWS
jgi:hypothetical protein